MNVRVFKEFLFVLLLRELRSSLILVIHKELWVGSATFILNTLISGNDCLKP